MAAHQTTPSLGFSRQEHWSGLPFPSPMHESEKWKWSPSVVSGPSATPWTAAFQAPPSMGFSRQEYWSGVPLPSPKGTHNLRLKMRGSLSEFISYNDVGLGLRTIDKVKTCWSSKADELYYFGWRGPRKLYPSIRCTSTSVYERI